MTYLLIGAAVSVFTLIFVRESENTPVLVSIDSCELLTFHTALPALGYMMVGMGLFFVFYIPDGQINYSEDIGARIFLTFLFCLLGYLILKYAKGHKVKFTNESITVSHFRKKDKTFSWGDIESYHLNKLSSYYEIRLADKSVVKVHQYLTGVQHFISKIDQSY